MPRVDSRGRIVLPLRMRKALHLDTGARVAFEQSQDGILVRPLLDPEEVLPRFRGALGPDTPGTAEDPLAAKRIWGSR